MIKKYLFLLSLLLPCFLNAQEGYYNFTNYSTLNGLPTNAVQSTYPDSYGFLWLATFDGLFRWDGYTYKKYIHEENNPGSLTNNIVNLLYEDRQRRLWVGTIDGLSFYDRTLDTFVECQLDPAKKVPVKAIVEDNSGQLWVGTSDGLCKFDPATRKATWFRTEKDRDVIFCMTLAPDNTIWLGTFNRGLLHFSVNDHRFLALNMKAKKQDFIPNQKIRSILADKTGKIWIGTENKGVFVLNSQGEVFQHYQQLSSQNANLQNTINCLYEDTYGTIWIGVKGDQLYHIRKGKTKPAPLLTTSLNNTHEQLASITSIQEDRFGNTWFASIDKGLFQTNVNKNVFKNYLYNLAPLGKSTNSIVSALHEDGHNKIWIGTNSNGLFCYDPQTNVVSRPVGMTKWTSASFLDIKADKDGDLWLASWGNGLFQYNPRTSSVKQYLPEAGNAASLIYYNIKTVLPDDSLIWIGTHGEGLAAFDKKQNRFIHYKNNTVFPIDLHQPTWINHLFKDSKKRLWISTYDGVYVYNGIKLLHYSHNQQTTSLSGNSVNMVMEDRHGYIWIASESGLDRYVEGSETFQRFGEQLNRPGSIKSIVQGPAGQLWLGSLKGLISFNPTTGTVRYFDMNDGLPTNDFFQKAALKTKTGELYFGSPKGFTHFEPAELRDLQTPSYFYFTDFSVFNEEQSPNSSTSSLSKVLPFTEKLEIRPDQAFFSIGFQSVNLYAPGRTLYQYKLDGLHNQWIDANGDRKISFMNLAPGEYSLHVRFTDMNGKWHDAPKSLSVVVLPAWWQTWWFRMAVALLMFGAAVALFYVRVAAVKRRNRKLKEEVKKRTNELRVSNESLVEQNYKVLAQKESLEQSNREIRRQSEKILMQQNRIITQNHALQHNIEKLREANATKDHFFSILAHDLKNPVFSLTEITTFIKANYQKINHRELEEYIAGIHKSSQSVYELLVNLLNWSRTQMNNISTKPVVINLQQMIDKNCELIRPQLAKKHIQLKAAIDPSHFVFADYDMIDVVIRNIISNSIKFTDYNGSIEITSSVQGKQISLCITDSGIGIQPEQIDKLFKVDKTKVSLGTAGEKGTGLGLVISKEFVEKNAGTIGVESVPCQGTSFFIKLPVPTSIQVGEVKSSEGTKAFTSLAELNVWETMPVEKLLKIKNKKVLIVDDNEEVRKYLKLVLSEVFDLQEASNGEQALTMATENPPAIIISDVLMPDMNGLQFCKAIKTQTATSHIPVMLLTSRYDDAMQVNGYESGADIYLTKPVKQELLIQVLLNILQNSERLRENILEKVLTQGALPSDSTSINKLDEAFINKLVRIIEDNVSDPSLDSRLLCKEMATSRTVLYTKLKTLTGQTVHEFIKSIRLRKSLQLLLDGELSIRQIAFEVGFNSHSYFDKCFIKQYNMGPKEYVNKRNGRIA